MILALLAMQGCVAKFPAATDRLNAALGGPERWRVSSDHGLMFWLLRFLDDDIASWVESRADRGGR